MITFTLAGGKHDGQLLDPMQFEGKLIRVTKVNKATGSMSFVVETPRPFEVSKKYATIQWLEGWAIGAITGFLTGSLIK